MRSRVQVFSHKCLHHVAEWLETVGEHAHQHLEQKNLNEFQKSMAEFDRGWRELEVWRRKFLESIESKAKNRAT